MKNITLFFAAIFCFPVLAAGQLLYDLPSRKQAIERWTRAVYTVKEFRQIEDSLQLSLDELSDYPVLSPVRQPVILSGFGMRRHPIYGVRKFHTGIDFPKAKGTAVYATGNGVVIRRGYNSGYGNYIEIQHAGGFRSFYAHLSKILVAVGDSVSITQQIGCVGNSGTTTGCHLHYEIRKGNRYLNPAGWCYCLYEMKIQTKKY